MINYTDEDIKDLIKNFNNSSGTKRNDYRQLIINYIRDQDYHYNYSNELENLNFTEEDKRIIWQGMTRFNSILIRYPIAYSLFACNTHSDEILAHFKRNNYIFMFYSFHNLHEIFEYSSYPNIIDEYYKKWSITIYNHLDRILPESILKYKNESIINIFEYGRHEKKCAKLRGHFQRYIVKNKYLVLLFILLNRDLAWLVLNYLS